MKFPSSSDGSICSGSISAPPNNQPTEPDDPVAHEGYLLPLLKLTKESNLKSGIVHVFIIDMKTR